MVVWVLIIGEAVEFRSTLSMQIQKVNTGICEEVMIVVVMALLCCCDE